MTELELKYIEDRISPEELEAYAASVDRESDNDIASRLEQAWASGRFQESCNETTYLRMKNAIDSRISTRRRIFTRERMALYAAAISFILLVGASLWIFKDEKVLNDNVIALSTGIGEKTGVTLPDGTLVNLGEASSLCYTPASFGKKVRNVSFAGEGYFTVASNPERPFIVKCSGMDVKVTGTRFLLLDRTETGQSEVMLDEGSLELSSHLADDVENLVAGQKAVFDNASGHFTILSMEKENGGRSTIDQIAFVDKSLSEVLEHLSLTYNVKLQYEENNLTGDNFTGYLPSNNLVGALDILSIVYDLEVSMAEGGILLK